MAKRNLFYLLLGATTGGGGGTDTSDATATPADIRLDKTAYGAEGKMTGTIPDYDGTTEPTSGKSLFTQLVDGSLSTVTESDLLETTAIGRSAFQNRQKLTTITIPNNVTSLEGDAFYNCTKLSSVNIGLGISTIGSCGFATTGINTSTGCTFTFKGTTPPTIQADTFNNSKINKIVVPAGTSAAYKAATNWSALADYIEEAGD